MMLALKLLTEAHLYAGPPSAVEVGYERSTLITGEAPSDLSFSGSRASCCRVCGDNGPGRNTLVAQWKNEGRGTALCADDGVVSAFGPSSTH